MRPSQLSVPTSRTAGLPKWMTGCFPITASATSLSCWGAVCLARGHRAVVPESLRSRVLQMAHEGHLGVVKVKQRCRDTVWWPHIDPDVEELVRNCACCLLSGKLVSLPQPLSPQLLGRLHPGNIFRLTSVANFTGHLLTLATCWLCTISIRSGQRFFN